MSKSARNRPKSASFSISHHQQPTKQYRIQEQQCYNYLKNNIYKTFGTGERKVYEDIKELTERSTSTSKEHNARIDRLCVKYSITPNYSKSKMFSGHIDSQYIAKHYVKQKSKEKQKEVNRQRLKQQILLQSSKVNVSSRPRKNEEFFKLTTTNLKNLQKSVSKSERGLKGRYDENDDDLQNIPNPAIKRGVHPYMKIYQQSQAQALRLLLKDNKIQFKMDENYPQLQQADEWQKYQKNKKQIYCGLKRMRNIYSARQKSQKQSDKKEKERKAERYNKQRENPNYQESFYLT